MVRAVQYSAAVSWRSFWSAPGGRISCAVVRIAIATSLVWTLARMSAHALDAHSALYVPHGVWLLYPRRPPTELLRAIELVGWIATLAALVGAWTRPMHAIGVLAVLALATYEASSAVTWSHQNVPPLLAGLAFLGARGGDALSVDALVRRLRGRPPIDVAGGYQASVRLVLVVVASIFFVAATVKLASGGPRLGWALSDNLRHQILLRFDWFGRTRTPLADWLLIRSWRYESFALLNLCSQLAPMGAVLAIDRPIIRAALGLVWIGELVGLGVVMAYWDLHWLPLAAVFVDWDRLARVRRAEAPTIPSRMTQRFALGFLAFYAVQALVLDQRLNAFPFSSFPMFAEIRAKRPFGRHQSFDLIGTRIELVGASPDEAAWFGGRAVHYRELWRERPTAVRRELQAILSDVHAAFPDTRITGVRAWLAVDRAPAYPAPAELVEHDVVIVAELDGDGFRTALGCADGPIALSPMEGLTSLVGFGDDLLAPIALSATKIAGGFAIAPGDELHYLVGERSGLRWLIAVRGS